MNVKHIFFALILFFIFSCDSADIAPGEVKRFTMMLPQTTKISFSNTVAYTEEFNTYTYRNFYNGAGVGIGDLNNDGLPDIFFCGNMVSNALYVNKGNFKFEDVTKQAGVASDGVWSTGVSLADVNGDGLLDIYVCKSGKPEGPKRHNELFINLGPDKTGVPVFEEKAIAYGIGDYGLSTHAAFFDYDKDGDLDMYLLNNSIRSVGGFDLRIDQRNIRDPQGGNKLYRNDGERFTDVSEHAGIYGSMIGYGLGVTIGDVDRDGWQDIFVSNDFFEKDYLYINNRNGTFTESLETMIGEISLGSMGADMGDLNNDGYPEIFVTEMLPEDESRLKTKTFFEDWDKYDANDKAGYYRQFSRNVLQLNRGPVANDTTESVRFSEISRYAGVNATDWSWGALLADLDNDGLNDIYVANGIYKDLTDQDYINFYADPVTARRLYKEKGKFLKELIDKIPSTPLSNFAFHNNGDLTFSNATVDWGLDRPGFSNGSAYGDLDNDGDLDLVVNNENMAPFILRNNTETHSPGNHFLSIKLTSASKNRNALGAQVTIKAGGRQFYRELAPMRGYQSTVDQRLHFGLGTLTNIDSVIIVWPDLRQQILTHVETNQMLVVNRDTTLTRNPEKTNKHRKQPLFSDASFSYAIRERHQKTDFIDFNRDPLLFQMLSAEGPKLAVGDINRDGRDDVFIGSGKNQVSALYIQNREGNFKRMDQPGFSKDQPVDDTCAEFFDADGDGALDLYVGTGGNEFLANSPELADKLFINDGKGNYRRSINALPRNLMDNNSCVKAGDFDRDGDNDLFVGVRTTAFQYGMPVSGVVLQNNGKGKFEDVTRVVAPDLINIGMITDAAWLDYDLDHDLDLVIVGDWMPIVLLKNENGKFKNVSSDLGLDKTNGFWNCIEVADLDGDGDPDLVAGNHGLNTRFQSSAVKPAIMYVNDFDGNGKVEQVITTYRGEKAYPLALRTDLMEQIPSLKKKYLKHSSYALQTVNDIFGPDLMRKSTTLNVFTTVSLCLINKKNTFVQVPLPPEAQFSPVYAIDVHDYDDDGKPDILLGGNFYWSKPEVGIYDAGYGLLLKGTGDGKFLSVRMKDSGICITGETRDIKSINTSKGTLVVVARNNAAPVVLKKK